ncbi:5085_t:CDS:2 [Funneliformis caledonium]|uniref:5085_t:CDS:1 n=1 Tax=Funneliformis caledonium TaxID=1117310 RepID=A0A9N9BX07_9GLOM|nr:5085_t:CDS:2 [Funneliformis caledonium]
MTTENRAFKRLVEVGRVVFIDSGEDAGKLAVIVEIIDHNRALIDGPSTGVARHAHAFRGMTLTDLVVRGFPRGAGSKIIKKYFDKEDILIKWNKSTWARKLDNRTRRAALTDFDRFKLLKFKKQRRFIVQSEIAKLRKNK